MLLITLHLKLDVDDPTSRDDLALSVLYGS